jgi:SOH1
MRAGSSCIKFSQKTVTQEKSTSSSNLYIDYRYDPHFYTLALKLIIIVLRVQHIAAMNIDRTMHETVDNDQIGSQIQTLPSTDDNGNNSIQRNSNEYNHNAQHQLLVQQMVSSLPENRFELELEFVQAFASPAFVHFLATSRLDESLSSSLSSSQVVVVGQQQHHQQQQSPFQQLQPFLHYLYNTYSQPEYARFLRYPHALYFLESLLIYDDTSNDTDTTITRSENENMTSVPINNTNRNYATNKLWTEWTIPSFRNFCHQQQFLAWQYRHATCYGVGSITSHNTNHDDDPNQHQHLDTTTTTTSAPLP